MNETGADRHPGRRAVDPHGIMQHPWVRKAVGIAAGAAMAVAGYFWNESRNVIRDVSLGQIEMVQVRADLSALKSKVEESTKLSEQQRTELRQDVRRVEDKVDGINTRLSRWFERASPTQRP